MKKAFLALLLLCLSWLPARADSPLTAGDFWEAYAEIPEVTRAHQLGQLDERLCAFLLSSAPLDQKAALLNALPFRPKELNCEILRAALAKKYAVEPKFVEARLTGEEACCLGYVTARENFMAPEFGMPMLKKARSRLPHSFTVAILDTLVNVQVDGIFHQEKVWPAVAKMLNNKRLKNDMRPAARASILDYLKLYQ